MDLFPAIGKAIQQLQGTDCNARLQTVNALKMTPTLLQYGPIGNIINFLHFYQNHHTLDEVPKPTVRTMDTEYATVEEWTKALQYHTASLQKPENSGIQLYTKCLECILVTQTAAYDKQVEENKRLLNVKKTLTRSSWVRQQKTLQWNWMEKVPQILNNCKTSSEKNATNVIANMHVVFVLPQFTPKSTLNAI